MSQKQVSRNLVKPVLQTNFTDNNQTSTLNGTHSSLPYETDNKLQASNANATALTTENENSLELVKHRHLTESNSDEMPTTNKSVTSTPASTNAMHSRNACKKLKCPKCNWHYKYHETLDIHMKEKHSTDLTNTLTQQCTYCLENTQHPRLGRGEQYKCGYKPYRCDICDYSTTTKGNLSIHMQSDKHMNNIKEGGVVGNSNNTGISSNSSNNTTDTTILSKTVSTQSFMSDLQNSNQQRQSNTNLTNKTVVHHNSNSVSSLGIVKSLYFAQF